MLVETQNLQFSLPQSKAPELILRPANDHLLLKVAKLANSYPHPHSVLGRASAADYVIRLAAKSQHLGLGWYLVERRGEAVAAAHLAVYGLGDGSGHTLWKIRHPLLAAHSSAGYLTFLFDGLVETAIRLRPGTAKMIIFLSEFEKDAMLQASKSGFQREGCFENYYRLGETCFVYGRTINSRE
jgi:hypothetical protein